MRDENTGFVLITRASSLITELTLPPLQARAQPEERERIQHQRHRQA
jgi:hypothetical protein